MAIFPGSAITPAGGAGYTIDQSLRGNQADSSYLNRTPSSASNRKTYTISAWIKPSLEVATFSVLGAGSTGSAYYIFGIEGNDLYFEETSGGGSLRANRILRDPSAWYHLMASVDSTQATASDRIKLYVNGVQETSFSTESYMAQNRDSSYINNTGIHYIGRSPAQSSHYLNGYMAEVHFIDGQALDPSYFGEADETYGHWKPIAYTGTYGTNGFYLDFSNSADLGEDQAGSNDWTANNLAATDVVLDSPTNNFATMNPLEKDSGITLSEGNLKFTGGASYSKAGSTINFPPSGKWYLETVWTTLTGATCLTGLRNPLNSSATDYIYWYHNINSATNDGTLGSLTYTVGDVLGIAIDVDGNNVYLYKNNSLVSSITSGTFDLTVMEFFIQSYNGIGVSNFGQDSSFAGNKTAQNNTDDNGVGDFYYAPPSGFLALCTANLDTPAVVPGENFNTVLWTGNGSTQSITGVGFQPDFTWIKSRSSANWHQVQDAVRGATKSLFTNETNAEVTNSDYLNSFDSDGFSLGNDGDVNGSSKTYVAWNWKADNTSGSTNTDGSITSTVAANPDAGFSIVSYTGNGTAGATVGHGLSSAPEMYIVKNRDGSYVWYVYHADLTTGNILQLNATDAQSSSSFTNSTEPTSSVFSLGSAAPFNGSGSNFIAYCFHSVDGFSKFGSYAGDTSGLPFVYCGFKPRWILIKVTNATANWYLVDTSRNTYNVVDKYLLPSSANAEGTFTTLDVLSNGFKFRGSDASFNQSGNNYIYMAFAEFPTKFANAR
jgi:hypothetical protein